MAAKYLADTCERSGLCCPICLQQYRDPRTLTCIHIFCQSCIHQHILKQKEGGHFKEGIECPLCRKITPKLAAEMQPEDWSKSTYDSRKPAALLHKNGEVLDFDIKFPDKEWKIDDSFRSFDKAYDKLAVSDRAENKVNMRGTFYERLHNDARTLKSKLKHQMDKTDKVGSELVRMKIKLKEKSEVGTKPSKNEK
ncbi:E3 ubiquitin-protein ligase RNF170-like [Mercenaria mercenaria]|uniref:E3 ubiquitin-protein ligase RNF170-like n=1 Tax=Mercenaria mercenaria TaxID=6596 RepID=UPI00234EB157|nr:E3 ubiquitin-protein ligase RNF170-like [Mercenaria mercenaria]